MRLFYQSRNLKIQTLRIYFTQHRINQFTLLKTLIATVTKFLIQEQQRCETKHFLSRNKIVYQNGLI